MYFEATIARSHLRSRREDAGLGLVAGLAILGVAVGVGALVVVLSVLGGFNAVMRDRLLAQNAHEIILQAGGPMSRGDAVARAVRGSDGVVAAAPFVVGETMLVAGQATAGVVVKGIEPALTEDLPLARSIREGPRGRVTDDVQRRQVLASLAHRAPSQVATDQERLPGILVGAELARRLGVRGGDRVHLVVPGGGGVPGGLFPRTEAFRVAGTFAVGMVDFDGAWTVVALPDARRLFGLADDQATGVEARLADARVLDAALVARSLQEELGPDYLVRDWIDLNAPLFQALATERRVTTLIVFCITVVAGLGVLTRLTVTVLSRAPEIAILRALGASRAAVARIFVLEGLALGSAGSLAGTAAGLLLCLVLAHTDLDLGVDFNGQTRIPVDVEPAEVAAVVGSALLVCFAATLYPAHRAARLDPVEGLQGR